VLVFLSTLRQAELIEAIARVALGVRFPPPSPGMTSRHDTEAQGPVVDTAWATFADHPPKR
jgi:hypothetical protein